MFYLLTYQLTRSPTRADIRVGARQHAHQVHVEGPVAAVPRSGRRVDPPTPAAARAAVGVGAGDHSHAPTDRGRLGRPAAGRWHHGRPAVPAAGGTSGTRTSALPHGADVARAE